MAAQTTPKGMSSRLLTMKFMQRAAASTSSSPASNAGTPKHEDSSSKRRKVSHGISANEDVDSLVDRQAIQAALDEGERKREEALVKHAAELGDARWVLDVQAEKSYSDASAQRPLQVVQVGFAQIDSPNVSGDYTDSDEDTAPQIRRYNMGKAKQGVNHNSDDDDDSGSDSNSSDTGSSTDEGGSGLRTPSGKQGSAQHRTGYSNKRSAEQARAKELADKRRKKEVKLNTKTRPPSSLPSLSSGGGKLSLSSGGRPMQQTSFKCHKCGEAGHKMADCKKSRQRGR